MRKTKFVMLAAACAVFFAGCGSAVGDDTSAPQSVQATGGPSGPTDQAVVVTGEAEGVPVELAVGPVVREGSFAVLHVRATVAESAGDATLSAAVFGFAFKETDHKKANNVRLLETQTRVVYATASGTGGVQAVESGGEAGAGESFSFHPVFAAPAGETVSVLLPSFGLVEGVPVIDSTSPDAAEYLDVTSVGDIAALIQTEPDALIAEPLATTGRRELADGRVIVSEVNGVLDMNVSTDALFGADCEALADGGDAIVTAIAEQISGYSSGTLSVLGSTDDVATSDENLALSRCQAETVTESLGGIVDLGGYQVTTEGRGETEPVTAGTSDATSAKNRRIQVIFTPAPEMASSTVGPSNRLVGALSAAAGPVGTATDGVVVPVPGAGPGAPGTEVRVSVVSLRRVDRVIVGTLKLESVSGEPQSLQGLVTRGADDGEGREAAQLQFAATGVALGSGSARVFPLVHPALEAIDFLNYPLCDMMVTEKVQVGESVQATIVWPDVEGDVLTLDVPSVFGNGNNDGTTVPWRIVDVPVTEGAQG